ncbi:hypothetical protein ACQKPX_00055 [Photobacterium sp. DNB23_23_1]|uniref:DUF4105 domain-containing protein n=1 Tax=Photobacterium pectinilyticum TaxID=2906793 RepID=A0ABT1MZB4_9GAMM|nr:hypothetical protein [Photobacterium sp. ZSDE20]MCQ1057632.1 hypothetical protein [Photobacterium sp. ZSDE20]MDD1821963.1 hypothetical protein [Photobacterium sp. ZSDE20]
MHNKMLLVAALCSMPVLADDESWKSLTPNGWITTMTHWYQDDPLSAHVSKVQGLDFNTQYTVSANIAHSETGEQKLYFNFLSLNSDYMCDPHQEADTVIIKVNENPIRFQRWCIQDATYNDFYFSSLTALSSEDENYILETLHQSPDNVNFQTAQFELNFPATGFTQAWKASFGMTNLWNPSVQGVL